MPFKFTLLFNFGGSGFSETWWNNTGGTITDLATAPFDAFAEARDNLCATRVFLAGYRISDADNPRLTFAKQYPLGPQGSTPPDVVTVARLAICKGAGGKGRRQFWMRGMADDWTKFSLPTNRFVDAGEFTTFYNAFRDIVTATGSPWCIRTTKSRKDSANAKRVTGVTADADTGQTVLAVDTTLFTTDKPIIVSGFTGNVSFLNGTYPLGTGAIGATGQVTLVHKIMPSGLSRTYQKNAYVRQAEIVYVPITQMQLGNTRSRRVGKAFFVPAGRRRRR